MRHGQHRWRKAGTGLTGPTGMVVAVAVLAASLAVSAVPAPAGAENPPTFALAWGSLGAGNGQFNHPVGMAVSPVTGVVYVADVDNHRVQAFDTNGTYLGQLGTLGAGTGQFNRPHGVAIGPDGSIYVADTNNHRVQKFTAGGAFVTTWGALGGGNGQFDNPIGIAVDHNGNVYVTDSGGNRVQKFDSSGAYKRRWGGYGTANGRFSGPRGIAVSPDNKVYVVDQNNHRVQRFSGTGVYQGQFGSFGTAAGQFETPYGIAIDGSGNVYVAEVANHRVQKFTANGSPISSVGTHGAATGQFESPYALAVSADGTQLFVADTDNHRVQRFATALGLAGTQPVYIGQWATVGGATPNGVAVDASEVAYVVDQSTTEVHVSSSAGNPLDHWGSGAELVPFAAPFGIAVDLGYNVFVADTDNSVVAKFGPTGTMFGWWGGLGTGAGLFDHPRGIGVRAPYGVYVADTGNDRVEVFNHVGSYVRQWGTTGTGNGQFDNPYGVAVDSAGNVYVADTGNNRIQRFTSDGAYLGQWGTSGSGPGQFDHPSGVAVDAAGDLYVSDSLNHRVQKFSPTGAFLTAWGTVGTGDGQFNIPTGVAVGPSGTIYVTDSGNHRIQRFAPGSATTPAMSLSADQSSVSPGDPIDYHLTVTNTTAGTLTGIAVADAKAPDCEGPQPDLAPSASRVIDCSYNTGADDAGPYANAATFTSDQTNAIVSNTVTTQVGPALTVTMTAPTRVMATQDITYAIGVTNNTALSLTGVRISDSVVPGRAGPVADIGAGATTTVNCIRSTTDLESGGTVFNAATVDASGARAGLATAVTRIQGRVTGTITGPGGPIAGAFVLALDRDLLPLHGDTTTNVSGVYQLGLDPGRYFLAFLDPSGHTLAEYSNDKTNALALGTADLTTVTVGAGPATTNASATLAAGFTNPVNPAGISGTVTDTGGPLAGVWVVAINGGVRSATRTNAAGQYTVGNLPPGATYLEFVDPAGSHAVRWYHDDNGANPTPIPLVAGQVVTGANEVLPTYP